MSPRTENRCIKARADDVSGGVTVCLEAEPESSGSESLCSRCDIESCVTWMLDKEFWGKSGAVAWLFHYLQSVKWLKSIITKWRWCCKNTRVDMCACYAHRTTDAVKMSEQTDQSLKPDVMLGSNSFSWIQISDLCLCQMSLHANVSLLSYLAHMPLDFFLSSHSSILWCSLCSLCLLPWCYHHQSGVTTVSLTVLCFHCGV